jgi:anaerobic magnesium-protoporphyrin IX monomethyl ester cyclase
MKIALINPPVRGSLERHWIKNPYLSLGYLSAVLERRYHYCEIVEGKFEKLTVDKVVERVIRIKPDLIGITSWTMEIQQAANVADCIKNALKSVPIVIGGSHANALPKTTLIDFPAFDFLIYGQGEDTLCELVDNLKDGKDFSKINGLVYRSEGNVIQNSPRVIEEDLTALPFPAWHLFPYTSNLSIMTERGCPYQCIFCARNLGKRIRSRPPEHVVEELEHIINRFQPRRVDIEDENFGLHRERTKEILSMIIKKGFNKKVSFGCQSRVDVADQELYQMMRQAGFIEIALGIESGNQEILKTIKKSITLDQAKKAVALAKSVGLKVQCFFILGHPYETIETIRNTIDLAVKLKPHRLSFALMVPYPGTEIYEMAKRGEGGYRLLSNDWKEFDKYSGQVMELESISVNKLKMIQMKAYMKVYLYNLRFIQLIKLIFQAREVLPVLFKQLIASMFKPENSIK